jgi:Putative zinc-binding metallo-peptidase
VPSAVPASHGSLVAKMINEKYGVQVVMKDQTYPVKLHSGLIRATDAQSPDLDRYCTVLAQEFLLYPPGLIRRSRLTQIVLCHALSYNGQTRAAVPDFEHDTLYLDVLNGSYSSIYQRVVIHHEFFHIIDYQDDGEVYSDERWARLNPRPFKYGKGGEMMQDDHRSGLPSDVPGFVTGYATSGVEEDKAETFAHMMTIYADVSKRAATDAVIDKKMSAMKVLLAKFCPDMNEAFWDQMRAVPPGTVSFRGAGCVQENLAQTDDQRRLSASNLDERGRLSLSRASIGPRRIFFVQNAGHLTRVVDRGRAGKGRTAFIDHAEPAIFVDECVGPDRRASRAIDHTDHGASIIDRERFRMHVPFRFFQAGNSHSSRPDHSMRQPITRMAQPNDDAAIVDRTGCHGAGFSNHLASPGTPVAPSPQARNLAVNRRDVSAIVADHYQLGTELAGLW